MFPKKIGFIGLGHIGGSIAKSIHRIHPEIELIACDTSAKTLADAMSEGLIAAACKEITEDFAACDIIYLCAPVLENNDLTKKLLPYLGEGAIVTDIGSVKTAIHKKVQTLPEIEAHFIGGHPMCGTEHTGFSYSTPKMLENCYYILTPSDTVPTAFVDSLYNFTKSIGAIPMCLDYAAHDHIIGSVSHLPHMISATLVNMIRETDDAQESMRTLAAGGFRDITRISSSSPVMWENISIANREEIVRLLDDYIQRLSATKDILSSGNPDRIENFFRQAKDYRDSFQLPATGAMQPIFQLFCYLDDEVGGIADVATILASESISIKNIGILHNREYEEGVLQLEFYYQSDYERAVAVLRKYSYTVYEKK